jgi:outer membrane receptor protein involved in Fe transport
MIAPSVKLNISKDVELYYSGEFHKKKLDGGYSGLPVYKEVISLSPGATVGQRWANESHTSNTNQVHAKVNLDNDWEIKQGFFIADYKADFPLLVTPFMDANPGAFFPITATPITAWTSNSKIKNKVSQTEIYGKLNTGAAVHNILFGYEYALTNYFFSNKYTRGSAPYYMGDWQYVDVTNPQSLSAPPPADISMQWDNQNNSKSNAIYAQDHISLGKWKFLAGLRAERVRTDYNPFIGAGSTQSQTVSATTGRFGVLYAITPSSAAYYSISQSFSPNLSRLGLGGVVLPSQQGIQSEVGLKHTVWDGLEATISVFDIKKTNMPKQLAAPNSNYYEVSGTAQSTGWEASLNGRITRTLKVVANVTVLNARITNGTDAGSKLYGAPEFAINVWGIKDLNLDLPGKASVGMGLVHVAERSATTPNTAGLNLPSYTSVDLGVFYKVNKINVAFNAKNVTNAKIIDPIQNMFVSRRPNANYLLTVGVQF